MVCPWLDGCNPKPKHFPLSFLPHAQRFHPISVTPSALVRGGFRAAHSVSHFSRSSTSSEFLGPPRVTSHGNLALEGWLRSSWCPGRGWFEGKPSGNHPVWGFPMLARFLLPSHPSTLSPGSPTPVINHNSGHFGGAEKLIQLSLGKTRAARALSRSSTSSSHPKKQAIPKGVVDHSSDWAAPELEGTKIALSLTGL